MPVGNNRQVVEALATRPGKIEGNGFLQCRLRSACLNRSVARPPLPVAWPLIIVGNWEECSAAEHQNCKKHPAGTTHALHLAPVATALLWTYHSAVMKV